jgi:hypothetical protein
VVPASVCEVTCAPTADSTDVVISGWTTKKKKIMMIPRITILRIQSGVRITTRQIAKCEWNSGLASKNTNPLASLERNFFPLTYPFYSFGQFFSDLASENTELTHQFGECLEKLIHTADSVYFPVDCIYSLCIMMIQNLYTQDLMYFPVRINTILYSSLFSVRKTYIDLLNGNPRAAISPLDLEISQKCEQLLISEPTFFDLKGSVGNGFGSLSSSLSAAATATSAALS